MIGKESDAITHIVKPETHLPQSAQIVQAGLSAARLLTDYLDDAANLEPDRVAVIDLNSVTGRPTTLSYRQLRRRADRIALGMVALGINRGEVVSFQMPNWWEFIAIYLACVRIGAIANPVMPIFRQRELSFMLGLAESRLFIVPQTFRGFDYPRMAAELRDQLPSLKRCLVVGGESADSFEAVLLGRRWEDEMPAAKIFTERRPSLDDITELLYTSGTTGEPKGVLHSANTLFGDLVPYSRCLGLTDSDAVLMASPMAHQTGFLIGMVLPIALRAKTVLQDMWSAETAAQRIQDEGVTFSMASTPFLADLTDSPEVARYDTSSLRTFVTAGAPIPRALVQRAREKLRMNVVSAWGMTENGAVTTTRLDDPPEKIFGTDGIALPGFEVRVVDADGKPLPPNTEGQLQERGPGDFVGYLKDAKSLNRDRNQWFDTGDLARMDESGYIRITGRAKDIIIRGGENIPVVEVENLLYRHPAVQEVAIVAMPDERLGERGCAFVILRTGQVFTFDEMTRYLEEHQMARQYFPERLEIVDQLPRTASGKIQKFRLREIARNLSPMTPHRR
jgi:cyclohexanecarboxylate-CoA ligase